MLEEDFPVREDTIVLTQLPGRYQVPDFLQRYESCMLKAIQEAMEQEKFSSNMSLVVFGVGILLCLVGFLTLVFGPETVYVSWSGPSFLQFIQLYPGPIVTVGGLLCAAAGWLNSLDQTPGLTPEQYLFRTWRMVLPDGSDYGKELVAIYLENDAFFIGSESPSAAELEKYRVPEETGA